MKLKPIHNHIIFKFVDGMKRLASTTGKDQTMFEEKTNWGFEISAGQNSYDESAKRARWATVVAVGHEVPEEITPGVAILIEPLKWTKGFSFEGEMFWRTDSDWVLATADEAPAR